MIYKIMSQPLVMIAITAICIVFIFSLQDSSYKRSRAQLAVSDTQREVSNLESGVEELRSRIDSEETKLMVEKIIRDELLMNKEGEYTVQLTGEIIVPKEEEVEIEIKTPFEEWVSLVLQK